MCVCVCVYVLFLHGDTIIAFINSLNYFYFYIIHLILLKL